MRIHPRCSFSLLYNVRFAFLLCPWSGVLVLVLVVVVVGLCSSATGVWTGLGSELGVRGGEGGEWYGRGGNLPLCVYVWGQG